jgi:hypothetical protein
VTERDSIELLINIQTKGQEVLASLAGATKKVEDSDKAATDAANKFRDATDRKSESMTGAVLKAQLLADGIFKLAGAVKSYTVESAQYAARTEQVSAVMDNLARVNGMSVTSVRMQANAIKELGITTQESRNVINLMIGSNLDLSKSLELTRMAQNAAKVAGINSSEALQRLVYAITSAQPEMLRTLGIAVNFEGAYSRWAQASGRTSNSLTEQEKLNIRLNAVLSRGPMIDGSYVMSLTTAAGQMQSLTRYTDELKNALGTSLQPALFDIVTTMEKLTKYAQENVDTFSQLTGGVTALGVASAVFAATPFLPLPARGAVAGAAGAATYLAVDQDKSQANVDKYDQAFKKLDEQKKLMDKQLALGLIDDAAFKRFSDQLPKYREMLRARFIEEQAELFKQRQANFSKMSPPGTGAQVARLLLGDAGVGIGAGYDQAKRESVIPNAFTVGGVTVTKAELEAVMNGQPVKFDKAGLVANNPLMNQNANAGVDKTIQQRADAMRSLLSSLEERGLDPLARIIADTQHRLREMAGKFGALTAGERNDVTTAMRGALIRQADNKKVEPVESESLDRRYFLGGFTPSLGLPFRNNPTFIQDVDPAYNESRIASVREQATSSMRRYVAFQEQMVRLVAGPGGEAAAINTIADIRVKAAQREYDLSRHSLDDRIRMEAEIDQARKDRLIQFAQMQQQQLEKYKQAAGNVYDAMVAKGASGITDFLRGQIQVVGRTMFVNLAGEIFRTAKDTLKLGDMIGGQVGKDGKLTPLGRVLQGTPLGVDQSKLAMEVNTNETRLNTQAIKENTAAVRGGGGTGTGAADGTADVLDKVAGSGKLGGKFQRVLGTAMTIGVGAYGLANGVRQGGAGGALSAIGGVAGMASGLIGSKLFGAALAAGPIGGILAGVGIGASLLGSMLGANREKFDKQQTETLNANKYEAPTASNRVMDIRGSDVDYDFTGRLRMANERPTVIQFNVNAMDVKGFLERSGDIAEALRKELRMSGPLALDIQSAVLG